MMPVLENAHSVFEYIVFLSLFVGVGQRASFFAKQRGVSKVGKGLFRNEVRLVLTSRDVVADVLDGLGVGDSVLEAVRPAVLEVAGGFPHPELVGLGLQDVNPVVGGRMVTLPFSRELYAGGSRCG